MSAGHPKLKNELRRPALEEIGARATMVELGGIQGYQRRYITWLLAQCRPQGAACDIGAFEVEVNDSDGDGIADEDDACPTSDLNPTVVIDGCDSGVPNRLSPNGCTIADQVADCAADATTRGAFVSCVDALTIGLRRDRLITGPQKGAINRCAAQADIP